MLSQPEEVKPGVYPASLAIQGWVWIPSWEVHISRIIDIFSKMIFLFQKDMDKRSRERGNLLTPRIESNKTGPDNEGKNSTTRHFGVENKFSDSEWGLYTACQEFDITVLGVASDGTSSEQKSSTTKKIRKRFLGPMQVWKKKHLKLKHMGKSHQNRNSLGFFHSQNPFPPRDSIWSKWSSYDVPKAPGLHLHSSGGNPGGPRMGRWMRGKFYMGGFTGVQPNITYFYSGM